MECASCNKEIESNSNGSHFKVIQETSPSNPNHPIMDVMPINMLPPNGVRICSGICFVAWSNQMFSHVLSSSPKQEE